MIYNFRLVSLLIVVSSLLCGTARAQTVVTTDLQVPSQEGSLDWFTLKTPVLGGQGAFHFTFGPTQNPGDPDRPDQAFTFGWNTTRDGFAAIAGEPALMWRFEDYYNPLGQHSFMESHLQYVSAKGQIFRPYGLQIDRDSDYMSVIERADAWSYLDRAGTQYLKAQPGVLLLINNMRIISYTNNQSTAFQMLNSDGTRTIRLPYVNNLDQTVVDVDAKGTVFGANVDAPSFSTGGTPGVTVSGSNCVITAITNGLITGATCSD